MANWIYGLHLMNQKIMPSLKVGQGKHWPLCIFIVIGREKPLVNSKSHPNLSAELTKLLQVKLQKVNENTAPLTPIHLEHRT